MYFGTASPRWPAVPTPPFCAGLGQSGGLKFTVLDTVFKAVSKSGHAEHLGIKPVRVFAVRTDDDLLTKMVLCNEQECSNCHTIRLECGFAKVKPKTVLVWSCLAAYRRAGRQVSRTSSLRRSTASLPQSRLPTCRIQVPPKLRHLHLEQARESQFVTMRVSTVSRSVKGYDVQVNFRQAVA